MNRFKLWWYRRKFKRTKWSPPNPNAENFVSSLIAKGEIDIIDWFKDVDFKILSNFYLSGLFQGRLLIEFATTGLSQGFDSKNLRICAAANDEDSLEDIEKYFSLALNELNIKGGSGLKAQRDYMQIVCRKILVNQKISTQAMREFWRVFVNDHLWEKSEDYSEFYAKFIQFDDLLQDPEYYSPEAARNIYEDFIEDVKKFGARKF